MSPDEQRIQAAFELGHPGALTAALADGSVGAAWLDATWAAARVLGSAAGEPPRRDPNATGVRRAQWLAASLGARLALTELRPAAAVSLTERARALADSQSASERIECGKLERWVAITWSRSDRSGESLFEPLLEDARAHGESAHVVELTALAALAAAERGDLEEATRAARLASRMARTEEMPQPAALANVILARARRLAGSPYLAATITSRLRRFAPASFHPWLGWELVLAAGASAPSPLAAEIGADARALLACLESIPGADSSSVSDTLARLAESECALVATDTTRLRFALEPGSNPRGSDRALSAWWAGAEDTLPYGLAGVCPADTSAHGAIAVAVSSPDATHRLLSMGAALLPGARVTHLEAGGAAQQRVLSTLATLVLAGRAGLSEAELFGRVYGFAYKPQLHRGAFNTVLHRARACLGDAGQLDRTDSVVRLLHEGTLVVFDPRCRLATRDRVLRQLATAPRIGARQIAAQLELPLRSVQAILGELTQEGLCASSRSGRRVEYHVEDTTFHEPTLARARPPEAGEPR